MKQSLSSGAGRSPPPTEEWKQTSGGVRSPCPTGATLVVRSSGPMYLRHGFRQPNFVPKFGASVIGIGPYALRGTARRGRRALRMVAESHRDCPGQRRTAERLRRGWEEGVEIEAGIIPEGGINVGQSLSHGEAVTAPFTQGSLRDGGCGLPRRPVGPPRNDKGFLSFRGAERRGNPFLFYDGRGFGPPSRRPLRKVYRSPSNGPM